MSDTKSTSVSKVQLKVNYTYIYRPICNFLGLLKEFDVDFFDISSNKGTFCDTDESWRLNIFQFNNNHQLHD